MEPNHSEKLYPCRIFRHTKNTCERAQLTFCLISSRKCSHLSVWRTRLVIPQVILPPSVRTRCYSAVEPTKQEQAAHSNNNCVKMRTRKTFFHFLWRGVGESTRLLPVRLGARFSKVPRTFRARKAIRKSTTCLLCKAGLFICCKGNKNNCKVSCLETPSFWRYKENYVTRNIPGKFRYEKQAPGWKLNNFRIVPSLGILGRWVRTGRRNHVQNRDQREFSMGISKYQIQGSWFSAYLSLTSWQQIRNSVSSERNMLVIT